MFNFAPNCLLKCEFTPYFDDNKKRRIGKF